MNKMADTRNVLVGLAGALLGGVLGYFAFIWIARQGFYALMLPGGLAGAGAGLFVTNRSVLRAVLCGVFAVGLGVFSEWRFASFLKDAGLGYFLMHLGQLQPITLLMIVAGGVFGYWFALGRERGGKSADRVQPNS